MAKRVRISSDDGATYNTLPGNTGSMANKAGEIDDTIFGQDFASTQTGLIDWTVNANGLFKGFAGYLAKIKKIGTTTAFTAEATTLVTGKTYRITDVTKNVWDRTVAPVIKDGAAVVAAANILSIDYLFGRVTFITGYTVVGVITFGGSYFPTTEVGCTNSFTLTQTANANDNTCMVDTHSNGGVRTFEYGLKKVSLELQGIYKAANAFRALLTARTELIIEINPDGNSLSVARGFFKPMNTSQNGNVGDLEQETVSFSLSVPDQALLPYPFAWIHATATTLSPSIMACLTAWSANTLVTVAYLPDGTTGVSGTAVITDISLAGGLEAMNEFTVNMQGSGALASVP